ncbi:hypothetical protein [Providencia alcalifaciens]|uniref:hypothetical protein n=1 Tax=Providencia alcalifaciens TaxID=126385 RepID=UPI0004519E30|nr:hypothetical protein [Providencia alcalifaciens]EUD07375.1 hypothetical protein HMPREF1564_1771 [Providencia alcalifaciens R90-1475]
MNITPYVYSNQVVSVKVPVTESTNVQNHLPIMGESLALDSSLDVYQKGAQLALQLGAPATDVPFREESISDNLDKIKEQYRSVMMAMKYSSDGYKRASQPFEDGRSHIAATKDLIGEIHEDYQKKYGEIVKASTQYMQDINTALSKLSANISSGSDGKIKFKPKAFLMDFDKVVSKYSGMSYGDYYSFYETSSYSESELLAEYCEMWGQDLGKKNTTDNNTSSKGSMREYLSTLDSSEYGKRTPQLYTIKAGSDIDTEFNFWNKKLSGQGFVVKKIGKEIHVYPDFKAIREIYLSIRNAPVDWDGSDMVSQSFQSLQTAMDAQKNTVNSSVSRLLETFRQDNSHFETLVQLLIQLIKDLNQNNMSLINI